jgi:acetyltransferase-like isoleucine patch superfamily enzyme
MVNIYRHLALSDTPLARMARRVYWGVRNLSVPAPRVVVKPLLWIFLAVRSLFYFVKRVFICEPLFKAYCKSYGRNLHTDVYIHWVQGKGDIIIGDDVAVDGKCAFTFTHRFSDRPTIVIGNHTRIHHGCSFTVGKQIMIGDHCLLAGGVRMADSNGHPTDPEARLAGSPPRPEDIRPVTIGSNVWIGTEAVILPGVTIGDGSIVATRAVVRSDVAPYTIVAGNPARQVATLRHPRAEASARPDAVAADAS